MLLHLSSIHRLPPQSLLFLHRFCLPLCQNSFPIFYALCWNVTISLVAPLYIVIIIFETFDSRFVDFVLHFYYVQSEAEWILMSWRYECLFIVRGCRPGKSVQMSESEVRGLCLKSREIFLQQPILLELEAPLKICGE